MNDSACFEKYANKYFAPRTRAQIHEIDRLAHESSIELIDKITSAVNGLIDNITQSQKKKEKGDIQCVGIHILRTAIHLRNYRILLCAYDKRFLFDDCPIEIQVEFHEFFQPLDEIYFFLLENRREFNGTIKENHVQILIQKFIDVYRSYFTELCRISVQNLANDNGFDRIETAENFFIISGEYKGLFDEIYVTEMELRQPYQIQAMLHDVELGKEDLACKVYHYYHFDDCLFIKRNLSKSKFISCKFTSSNFNGAYLSKSLFSKCHFKQIQFEGAHIFDVCFHQCSFEHCDFSSAIGFITSPKLNVEVVLGFGGLSFRECNLHHVTFIDANLSGAAFTRTTFEKVSFEETLLERAIFSKENFSDVNLSHSQIDIIDLV